MITPSLYNTINIDDSNSLKAERFYRFSMLWGISSSLFIFLLITAGIRTNSIFALKDLFIYIMAIGVVSQVIRHRNGMYVIYCMLIFLWYMIMNYVILNPTYQAAINNIRQILSPLLVLLLFCQLQLNREATQRLLNLLCWAIIIVFGLGIIEQAFEIWPKLDLSVFFSLKGIETDENGLSYMFYEPLLGGRERMTSTFIDPISLGHFFSSAGILFFYLKDKNRLQKTAYYLCLAGMFFAMSKGAIFQFFIGVILLNANVHIFLRLLLVSAPFVFVQVVESKGIAIHINAFLNAIDSITFFGYGIGNAGNYSVMFGSTSRIVQKLQIGDTYIGSLLGQIGLLGTIVWIVMGIAIIYTSVQVKKLTINALIIFISIFTVSILSENTMNITSFIMPAIIIGLSLNIARNEHDLIKEYQ